MTKLVLQLLQPYRGWLIIVFAAMLVETAMSLAAPWPLKIIIDSVVGPHNLPEWLEWMSDLSLGQSKMGLAALAAFGQGDAEFRREHAALKVSGIPPEPADMSCLAGDTVTISRNGQVGAAEIQRGIAAEQQHQRHDGMARAGIDEEGNERRIVDQDEQQEEQDDVVFP